MKNDPRQIKAKFNCKCKETNKEIKKGEPCIYYPSEKAVYHIDSKQAEEYRNWKMDIDVLGCNY